MKRTTAIIAVLLGMLISFGIARPSHANLAAMGAIDPLDGFPTFYTDANGLSLAKCNVENLYSPNVLPRVLPTNDPGAAPTWMCTIVSTAGSPGCPTPGVNLLAAGCYNDMQPINPVGFANFPFETFYFNATITDALCPGTQCPGTAPGNTIGTSKRALLYLAAIEATFLTPTGGPPINQPNTAATVFQRIRIDLDIPVTGTYTVKHPYPTVSGTTGETFANVPAGTRAVRFTANFPAAGIPFSAVTTGPIGPFLRTAATEGGAPIAFYGAVDAAGVPIPGRQFIGDPNLKVGVAGQPPMTVTGSPVNQNFLSVCGPDVACSSVNYRQNQFQLMGMVAAVTKPLPIIDFNGDKKTDIAVWRPSDGNWYILNSTTGAVTVTPWGTGTLFLTPDVPVAADFDGDGKTDIAVWRPSDGFWYGINSTTGLPFASQWGASGDIPVHFDYDGDGKGDYAVFRPADGNWYIKGSLAGAVTVTQWGAGTDIPVPYDYDGDGKGDYAVFRPADGNWYIKGSLAGAVTVTQWGTTGDIPVPGDYDGDGKGDYAVFRPADGNWYIKGSLAGAVTVTQWGTIGDVPIPGDYDGDGKTDIAVWRPSNGTWYIKGSLAGAVTVTQWGVSTDLPIVQK